MAQLSSAVWLAKRSSVSPSMVMAGRASRTLESWLGGPRFEVAPDGAVWMIEDSKTGGRFYVAPKGNWVLPYAMQVF